MKRSLYTKVILIFLAGTLSMMAVVCAFLTRGVRNFYLNEFYQQMQAVFSNADLVNDLRSAAESGEDQAPSQLAEIIQAYSGPLGINSGSRNYYILDGETGVYITGSANGSQMSVTPNILTAIAGKEGYRSDSSAEYMDVALPITDGEGNVRYIVYIRDNKDTVWDLNTEIFKIIIESMLVGLVVSAVLSMFLAKTMVTPIQKLTKAAEKVASGDFSDQLETSASDEIGVLTDTFNDMASQLENNMDELRKSEIMRREFVANVSHELRTPITSIRSYAETLEETGDMDPEMQRAFLSVIVNESDRMTKIVQDLLTLSKFDAGSISFKFEQFSFSKSVRDVYNAMRLEAERHKHDFRISVEEDIAPVEGDRVRIEQVLINMVSNAIKYTSDGGKIRISAGQDGDIVWAKVSDNGIGIPKEDVKRVFERFYRVDKARSRESGGTGLGLSIAEEIVARHDGKISIRSKPGKGTEITLRLPVKGPSHE
jgi:signal transduction histidine kinase